jgi:biotin transporter BioY
MGWYIFLYLLQCILVGILAQKLAAKKGYMAYFWTGFFLSILGLIYVAGLPVADEKDRLETLDTHYDISKI